MATQVGFNDSCMHIELPADRPRADVPISDGSLLTLSPLLKSDRRLLEEGITEMSEESKYTRFGQGVGRLSGKELDYLSDVDQRNHVAWGAVLGQTAVGVGRYIVADDLGCAELAITVVDEFQDRGIGRALFQALVAVARHDGVAELCLEATTDNAAVVHVMKDLAMSVVAVDGAIEARLEVDQIPGAQLDELFVSVLTRARGDG